MIPRKKAHLEYIQWFCNVEVVKQNPFQFMGWMDGGFREGYQNNLKICAINNSPNCTFFLAKSLEQI